MLSLPRPRHETHPPSHTIPVGAVEGAGGRCRPCLHVPLRVRSLVIFSREERREAAPTVEPAGELVNRCLRFSGLLVG